MKVKKELTLLTVQRVERHIIVNNRRIDRLCFYSKNLYNYCNFILRQVYFQKYQDIKRKYKYKELKDFKNLIKKFKIGKNTYYKIDEYDLTKRLSKLNQTDYILLPIQTSQNIIKLLYKNWKSFFKSITEYHKHPEKFKNSPNIPKYTDQGIEGLRLNPVRINFG